MDTQSNQEIINLQFNKLTIIGIEPSYIYINPKTKKSSHRKVVLCKCDCGNILKARFNNVKTSKTKSCQSCAYAKRPQSIRRYTANERWFNLHIRRRELRGIKSKHRPRDRSIYS